MLLVERPLLLSLTWPGVTALQYSLTNDCSMIDHAAWICMDRKYVMLAMPIEFPRVPHPTSDPPPFIPYPYQPFSPGFFARLWSHPTNPEEYWQRFPRANQSAERRCGIQQVLLINCVPGHLQSNLWRNQGATTQAQALQNRMIIPASTAQV